jgi:AcrR family transcriptional regulator
MLRSRDLVLAAVDRLAAERAPDRVSLVDVAREAGLSWPTVRRHVGGKTGLRQLLAERRTEATPPAQDTRGRVLAAAARVFARDGYAGATLDDVAAAAGLTKGAVYWHFPGKTDLFIALLEEHNRQQSATLPSTVAGVASAEGLAAALAQMFAACRQDEAWPALLQEFAASRRDPRVRERLRDLYRASQDVGRAVAQTAQAQGRLATNLDPDAVALLFGSLLAGLMQCWLVYPDTIDTEALIPKLADALWQGIAPRKETTEQ